MGIAEQETRFTSLVMAVIEETACEADLAEFHALLHENPEFIFQYLEQMRIHGMMCRYAENKSIIGADGRRTRNRALFNGSWWRRAVGVAAVAILLIGTAVWWTGRDVRSLLFDLDSVFSDVPSVRIISQSDVQSLEIPQSLPGWLQSDSGQLTVRLASGVELTLIGSTSLRIENSLDIWLENGRLLAEVPRRATGFTVHAPGLTAEDLGTIFSVSTINGVSDVFVFKGAVQVNDAEGEDVGLCAVGEGARSRHGARPLFFSADRAETQRLFVAFKGGAAADDPTVALSVVERIADQWMARYAPYLISGSVSGLRSIAEMYAGTAGGDESLNLHGQHAIAGLRPVGPGISNKKIVGTKNLSSYNKEKEMNTTKTVATLTAAAVMGVAGMAQAAVPEVSAVTMLQRTNSRIVDIGYTLAGEEAIVTLSIETNGVPLPDSAVTQLSGDVSTVVQPGTRSIVWNAGKDWPEHSVTDARALVTAWQTNSPPVCCVVDLTGGSTAETYPVKYYTSVGALPYGGITNEIYKSSYLVMNKISDGAFNMGEGVCAVTLTQDFYAGVFEVTQGQWYQVMNAKPSKYNDVSSWQYRPVEQASYDDIRGSSVGAGWPTDNSVDTDSFIGRLRTKAGIAGFDLPTEAQWEYACRAGTQTYYSDGLATPANTTSNAQMNVLGRYHYNGGKFFDGSNWVDPTSGCSPLNGTAIAGSYLPNAWGLYDMHGNVNEWCLDWYQATLEGGTDPKGAGAESGSSRVFRGGSWFNTASICRSAFRSSFLPSSRFNFFGFRLVRTLP